MFSSAFEGDPSSVHTLPSQHTPAAYAPKHAIKEYVSLFADKQNQMLINRNAVGRDVLLISEITSGSYWLDGKKPFGWEAKMKNICALSLIIGKCKQP